MKRVNSMSSYITFELVGVNFHKFLKMAKENNCTILNWRKQDFKTNLITLSNTHYKVLLRAKAFRNFSVKVKNKKGWYYFLKNIKSQIGLLLGLGVAVVLVTTFSFFTFHINIIGTKTIKNEEIISVLSKNGVKIGRVNSASNSKIEGVLKEAFSDISLVSVIKRGTNIVINIKEREIINTEVYEQVVAPTNMYITSFTVSQGTALKRVGDMVKKGEVIVGAYQTTSAGVRQNCKPVATLEVQAWYFGEMWFETKEVTYVKTGKSVISSKYFSLFGKQFLNSSKAHKFALYEEKTTNLNLFPNFLLPLKYYQLKTYELKEKVVLCDFEKSKAKLINESRAKAYNDFPTHAQLENESVVISQVGTKVLVQTVLQTTLTLNFS